MSRDNREIKMCGVFGFACNKPTKVMYKMATQVMIETETRGPHATGHAYLDKRGRIKSKKAAIPASEYVLTGRWNWMERGMPDRLIGHCRFTTQGTEDDNRNNHPHVGDRYALIHNGVLKGYEYRPWAELCKSECDSEAILRVMELGENVEKAVARVFNCFYDSNFSVIVLDRKTKEMHFFRNPGRPLRVWRGTDFIMVASTEKILEDAFQSTFDIDSNKVHGLDKWTPVSGTFYTIRADMTIDKKGLFDYTPERTTSDNTPDKVKQYSHYSTGSAGYGAPKGVVRYDSSGNMIYGFDA